MITKNFILLAATAAIWAVSLSCVNNKAEQASQHAAEQFTALWQNNDSAHIAQAVQAYRAGIDSAGGNIADYKQGFVEAVAAQQRDTLTMAAQILAMSAQELCEATAKPIVVGLLDGTLDQASAHSRVQLFYALAGSLNQSHVIKQWNNDIQALVNNMPIEQQMQVYAASSSPAALGEALKQDKINNKKPELIKQQIEALKSIYDQAQMAEFNNSFNSTH